MRLTDEIFASRVAAHAGVSTEEAMRAATAAISAIAATFDATDREILAAELPPALAAALRDQRGAPGPSILEQVRSPATSVGEARELLASTCGVLASALSDPALRVFRANVPGSVARLLVAPAPTRPAETFHEPTGRTLADGEPGSRHPISRKRD